MESAFGQLLGAQAGFGVGSLATAIDADVGSIFDRVSGLLPGGPADATTPGGALGRGAPLDWSASYGSRDMLGRSADSSLDAWTAATNAYDLGLPAVQEEPWDAATMDEELVQCLRSVPSLVHEAEQLEDDPATDLVSKAICTAYTAAGQRCLHHCVPSSADEEERVPVTVGLGAAVLPATQLATALREETQLWRLAERVFAHFLPFTRDLCSKLTALRGTLPPGAVEAAGGGGHGGGHGAPPFAIGAALPVDAYANDGILMGPAGHTGYDAGLRLLQLVRDWLADNAVSDVSVVEPLPSSLSSLTGLPGLPGLPGLRDDGSDPLAYDIPMWAATAAAAQRNRSGSSGSGGGGGRVGPRLDPDALSVSVSVSASNGSGAGGLAQEDQERELRLLSSCWQLLRAGRWAEAAALCVRYGQPWRAALLTGTDLWRDFEDETAGADTEDGNSAMADGDAAAAEARGSSSSSMVRVGNPFAGLFRATLQTVLAAQQQQQQQQQHGGAAAGLSPEGQEAAQYERAILAVLAGDARQLHSVPVAVRTWEDAAWGAAHEAIASRTRAAVAKLRGAQVRTTERLPHASLTHTAGAHCEADAAAPLPPADVVAEELWRRVEANEAAADGGTAAAGGASRQHYVRIAKAMLAVAAASAPLHLQDDEVAAAMRVGGRICDLVRILHDVVATIGSGSGSGNYTHGHGHGHHGQAAVAEEVRAAVVGNAAGGDTTRALSPRAPDYIKVHTTQLPPAAVPLLRFAVHFLLFLRGQSPVADHPVLSAAPAANQQLEAQRATVQAACDDIIYAYIRHLIAAQPRTTHVEAVVQLAGHIRAGPRAVRALASLFLALPYAPRHAPDGQQAEGLRLEALYGVASVLADLTGASARHGGGGDAGAGAAAGGGEAAVAEARRIAHLVESALRQSVLQSINLHARALASMARPPPGAGTGLLAASGLGDGAPAAAAAAAAATWREPADIYRSLGIVMPSMALPPVARRLGLSQFDYLRVTSLSYLTLEPSHAATAVAAANALGRMLITEAAEAEAASKAAAPAASPLTDAAAASALLALQLLWSGLGSDVRGMDADLADPILPPAALAAVRQAAAAGRAAFDRTPEALRDIAEEADSLQLYLRGRREVEAWSRQHADALAKAPLHTPGTPLAGHEALIAKFNPTSDKARHTAAVRMYTDVLGKVRELLQCGARAADSAIRAALQRPRGLLPGEHGSLLLMPDDALVVAAPGGCGPSASAVRSVVLPQLLLWLAQVHSSTARWLAGDDTRRSLFAAEARAHYTAAADVADVQKLRVAPEMLPLLAASMSGGQREQLAALCAEAQAAVAALPPA